MFRIATALIEAIAIHPIIHEQLRGRVAMVMFADKLENPTISRFNDLQLPPTVVDTAFNNNASYWFAGQTEMNVIGYQAYDFFEDEIEEIEEIEPVKIIPSLTKMLPTSTKKNTDTNGNHVNVVDSNTPDNTFFLFVLCAITFSSIASILLLMALERVQTLETPLHTPDTVVKKQIDITTHLPIPEQSFEFTYNLWNYFYNSQNTSEVTCTGPNAVTYLHTITCEVDSSDIGSVAAPAKGAKAPSEKDVDTTNNIGVPITVHIEQKKSMSSMDANSICASLAIPSEN